MTPLQWTLLCGFFTIYLLFGGTIFMVLEQHSEILNKEQLSLLRQDVQEILIRMDRDFYHNGTTTEVIDALQAAKEGVINRISEACGGTNFLNHADSDFLRWNYYNSVFFAFTVVTTIGYGHLSPTTDWSRIFVIFYALVGIPINGILLQGLGDYFSSKLVKVHKKSKEKSYDNKFTLIALIFDIIFYLIPGMVVFLLLPAGIFTFIENWPFLDSLYYAFVTLTTIGFGDFVAGMGDGHNIWLWVYKAVIIVWILFGLGYLMMILGFITKGLTHKKVRIVIENRLNNIRTTKEKLSKDVEYMRRVVNELYMIKIKPVFPDDEGNSDMTQYYLQNKGRTNSQPCLSQFQKNYRSLPQTPNVNHARRRCRHAVDDDDDNNHRKMGGRTMSETDLDFIDKHRTFEEAMNHCVLPNELLAAVVDVLSHNVVQDVLQAVDELNEFEEIEEEEMGGPFLNQVVINSGDDEVDGAGGGAGVMSSPLTSKKKMMDADFNYPSSSPWPLGMLTESDQEILITTNDEDFESASLTSTLEEVVIHADTEEPHCQHNKSGLSQGIIDKVNSVIRKISAGPPSPDGPSRKVSRNETDRRRKISSKDSSPSRKVSRNENDQHQHPARGTLSSPTSPRLQDRKSEHRRSFHRHHLPSRKISEESYDPNNSSNTTLPSRPLTVETTSLADFLRALDTVHQKLRHADPPEHKHLSNGDVGDAGHRSYDASDGLHEVNSSPSRSRRRKVGVFNPGFSYVNHAFNPEPPDDGDDPEAKLNTSSTIKL